MIHKALNPRIIVKIHFLNTGFCISKLCEDEARAVSNDF